jgi:hypothetical protein
MNKKWTLEMLQAEALNYTTRGAFRKGNPQAYGASVRKGILDQVCIHMGEPLNSEWTTEELISVALQFTTRSSFQQNNTGAYSIAHRRGILDEVCAHMPKHVDQAGENHPMFFWTLDLLQEAALRFTSRRKFQDGNRGAYHAAYRRGLLDLICQHMPRRVTGKDNKKFKWTDEKLQEVALNYTTRLEFQKKNPTAYQTAQRRGLLNQICSHMKYSTGSSIPERELLAVLKERIPNLISKFFAVKIPNKPHIKRFEVDILDPITLLGIEYDGEHHHSEEFLIKSKTKIGWTVEDAKNYHQIKDDALMDCHGIKILHIKGDDWKKDKKVCIQRCIKFLGVIL